MAQAVFNRYEKKYILSQPIYTALRKRLSKYMTEDEYGKHTICNIYYDTPDNLLIRRSIEKPVYKEKLRLRSYGIPTLDTKVFLEMKKKYKGGPSDEKDPNDSLRRCFGARFLQHGFHAR